MDSEATLNYLRQSLKMKICKKLIGEICSNELRVVSADDSTISLSITLKNVHVPSFDSIPDIPDEGDRLDTPKKTLIEPKSIIDILIVDDIEFNLSVLRKLIEGLHLHCTCENKHRIYTVHSALSGKQAIEFIEKQENLHGGYRLIIMDCLMPEMDGWETTLAIREMHGLNQIAVLPNIIAYSAFDSKEDIGKSKDCGMSDHISKPCTRIDLCQKITQWLKRSF